MKPAQVNVFVAQFAYGGNGGTASILPSLANWWAKVYQEMMLDERIDKIGHHIYADTPVTMVRNKAIVTAERNGMDFILMLDSDNEPDLNLKTDPTAKPFWKTSFDFAYNRLMKGLPTAIFAPYCGPPPHPTHGGEECVYAFDWETKESDSDHAAFSLRMPSRHDAAQRIGIHPAGAGPTGVMLYSLSAQQLIGHPKFKYEWTDETESEKGSTEDCYNTREISMAGWIKHDTDVVFCNWDAWAGHHKPKVVGKPVAITAENISNTFKQAVLENINGQERMMHLDFTDNFPKNGDVVRYSDGGAIDWEKAGRRFKDFQASERDNGHADPAPTDLKPVNGVPIIPRMVAGNGVLSVGHQTKIEELDALTDLTRVVAQHLRGKALRVVEIGSWVGESALAIEAGFGEAGGTVFCVDHWQGSENDSTGVWANNIGPEGTVFDYFKRNVGEKLGNSIRVIQDFSLDAAAKHPPQEADMIFIDAGHSYEECKADIEAWLPHLAEDGIMCGHDYDMQTGEGINQKPLFPGVKKAVQEVFAGCTITRPQGTSIWVVKMQEYRQLV